ncbi:MAG: hypothetical protein IKD72_10710, partial [Clostridia bacterium]|nr:hypothetical protein [Clostridia bacterium]
FLSLFNFQCAIAPADPQFPALSAGRSAIIPNHFPFVNTFFHLFYPFFSTAPGVSSNVDRENGNPQNQLFISSPQQNRRHIRICAGGCINEKSGFLPHFIYYIAAIIASSSAGQAG